MGALLPRLRVTKIVRPLGRILVPGFVGSPPLFSISTPIWASQSRAVLTLPKAEEGRLAPVRLKRDRPPDLHLSTQYLALCRSLAGFDFLGHDGQKGLPVLLGQPGFRMWKARGRKGGQKGVGRC